VGAPDFSRRSLADKFLYRALVRVNSVPNFNFLATSYGHIEGVPKWKGGAADLFRRPLADKFLHVAIVRANAYNSIPNFKFLSLIVSEMKRVSQNLIWGLLPPPPAVPHTLKLLRVLQVLGKIKQRAKFHHRICLHHAVMRICISCRLSIICAQKWGFWGFWGWRCENIVIWPLKGTTLREYASVGVSRSICT